MLRAQAKGNAIISDKQLRDELQVGSRRHAGFLMKGACVRMCADVYTCGACRRRVHVRTHSMLCSLLDHATSARMHSVPAHSAVDQLRTPFDPAMQTMVLAGSDTTATTLAFALAELARHPEIAAAAAAEVEDLIGNRDPAALGADVYQSRLPWVTAIANETLRL